jgi:hypothetical protein
LVYTYVYIFAQQVEGSPTTGGRSQSVWDIFAAKPGNIQDGSTPAVATDFYNKYKEDIALMKAMGVKNFRSEGVPAQKHQAVRLDLAPSSAKLSSSAAGTAAEPAAGLAAVTRGIAAEGIAGAAVTLDCKHLVQHGRCNISSMFGPCYALLVAMPGNHTQPGPSMLVAVVSSQLLPWQVQASMQFRLPSSLRMNPNFDLITG